MNRVYLKLKRILNSVFNQIVNGYYAYSAIPVLAFRSATVIAKM